MDTLQEFLTPGTYYPDNGGFSVFSPFERLTQIGYTAVNVVGVAGFFTNMIVLNNRDAALGSIALSAAGTIGGFVTGKVRRSREDSGIVQHQILRRG